MRIKAALYNAGHLEYGLVTISFPILNTPLPDGHLNRPSQTP